MADTVIVKSRYVTVTVQLEVLFNDGQVELLSEETNSRVQTALIGTRLKAPGMEPTGMEANLLGVRVESVRTVERIETVDPNEGYDPRW